MMMAAHAAPTHGCPDHEPMAELPTTVPRMAVRKSFSAVSTVVNGLMRIRMLMALDARKTMRNAAIAKGIISAL